MQSRAAFALIAYALFAGAAGAQTAQAVEWKVNEGGNGHWYRFCADPQTWAEARDNSQRQGGHLLTLTDSAEWQFVWSQCGPSILSGIVWIGGYQPPGSAEPAGGWRWVTNEPFTYTSWSAGCPNDNRVNGNEDAIITGSTGLWNDLTQYAVISFLVEWDADCNGDGIVDYGQIRSGQLTDDNTNGIPDVCETSITGVIPPSVPAQGGAAISINGRNFPAQPTVLVGGVPATSVVRVSETRLTATTPALLPGMASVSVNGFTLADGIYIRPECGSDLDQDGEVTASDIAIVLLDFGPCYATATSSQPVDSTPFLLKEEPDSGTPGAR